MTSRMPGSDSTTATGSQAEPTGPTDPADPASRSGSRSREPIWSRDLALVWVVNFCLALAFYGLITIMAVYAVTRFAVSDSTGGLAASIFVVGATVARLFAGGLVDRLGRRRMLWAGLASCTAVAALYLVADSLPLLLAVRATHGVLFAVTSTAAMTLAQARIPSSRRSEGTGYFALSITLSTAIGPLMSLEIVSSVGYDTLFWSIFATHAAACLLALLITAKDEPREPQPARERTARGVLAAMVHPAVLPIGLFMLVIGCVYSTIVTYLNSYTAQEGLQQGASLFFVAYATVMFVSRFVMGRLQDRRGDNVVVYSAIVVFAGALLLLGTASADWMIVATGALTGFGFGTINPACQAAAVSRVPQEQFGLAISTFFLMLDGGVGLGPVAFGLIAEGAGYSAMFLVLAGVMLLSALLYLAVHGRRPDARHGRTAATHA
ncbi:MFS transporter [Prauserella alba]|uniref:MFS transporter n=1 Tax=Prauserella alba TaxID=176898 RepID=A0ABN1V5H2_9PSEU|nr:MFS transporter [Prauserella alba]MCP2183259.1 putative arabinose efflux permease, MFS family [Prauserella alba]